MGNLTMHVYSLYVTYSYTIYLTLIYVYSTVPQHLQILATPLPVVAQLLPHCLYMTHLPL